MIESAVGFLAAVLFLVTLPGTIELALLTGAALLPDRKRRVSSSPGCAGRLAVLVPVHNEEFGMRRTLRSLLACADPLPRKDLIIMACNCTDRTVEIGREFGCTVLERIDPSRRGKGYGLDHAFRHLADRGYTAYVIVDADTVVEPNFLNEFRGLFARGAGAGQCVLRVANPEVNARTRLMNIAMLSMTFLRPLARHRLGLSAGIFGNGFGVSAATVRHVPYECFSIAEDLEYHTRLVRAGGRVEFLPDTSVRTDMCVTGADAISQRERWEGGRFRILLEQSPRLAAEVVLRGRLSLLEPLLDLLLMPLAYHVVLIALLALASTGPLFLYAMFALLVVCAHVAVAMVAGGAKRGDWKALAAVPLYLAWKLVNLRGILKAANKSTPWRRTARGHHPP